MVGNENKAACSEVSSCRSITIAENCLEGYLVETYDRHFRKLLS